MPELGEMGVDQRVKRPSYGTFLWLIGYVTLDNLLSLGLNLLIWKRKRLIGLGDL